MERTITITETTVGTVSTVHVGVGNPMEGSWMEADGRKRSGLVVELSIWPLPNEEESNPSGTARVIDVHEGQVIVLGSKQYRVQEIDPGARGRRGSVTLARLSEP